MHDFASLISAAREAAGLTQPDLQVAMARRGVDVSINSISLWCTGARRPHREHLEVLLDCLGVIGDHRAEAYKLYAAPRGVLHDGNIAGSPVTGDPDVVTGVP